MQDVSSQTQMNTKITLFTIPFSTSTYEWIPQMNILLHAIFFEKIKKTFLRK